MKMFSSARHLQFMSAPGFHRTCKDHRVKEGFGEALTIERRVDTRVTKSGYPAPNKVPGHPRRLRLDGVRRRLGRLTAGAAWLNVFIPA